MAVDDGALPMQVARSRLDRLRFVTQDPQRTSVQAEPRHVSELVQDRGLDFAMMHYVRTMSLGLPNPAIRRLDLRLNVIRLVDREKLGRSNSG